jgi:hypothetical protein
MSLTASEATCFVAELASLSLELYCCFSYGQELEPRLPRTSSEEIQTDITDDRGYRGNFKIGSGNHICDCPYLSAQTSPINTLE